ncbi:DUF1214 domain-containing protein [Pararhizobium sp.]|uniref:DUF1214 domain-containing protein n=1 Tax=Pararhizobium sp. TaxID=1977563 RepID=UPI00271AE3F8|nr:DUF1214 domain-containing protein [Pararhizobium sp.]MDO9417332.1 DUF1214 domain-containing protein [Pararhizobium sp.]
MFRIPFLFAIALAVAFGGGIFSAVYALKATVGFGAITLGPWQAFPVAQTADADPYAKAHRARAGRLLLGGTEGLSFIAPVDSSGAVLRGNCSYEIAGLTPPARFWTLHTVDSNDAPLDPPGDLPFAFNAWTALRQPDNSFVIHVSPEAKSGNWLALRHAGPFKLVLTLLDTPTAGSDGVVDLTMPDLRRTGCS